MRTIVLDTNCLIVILPSKSPFHKVWNELLVGNIQLCITNEILNEYEEMLHQKIPFDVADNAIQAILNLPKLKQVNPTFFWKLIKEDTDDNKFVDCAICGEAELIVTNDRHFNILNEIDFPKVLIQRIEDFTRSL